jgi:hypothetical protein
MMKEMIGLVIGVILIIGVALPVSDELIESRSVGSYSEIWSGTSGVETTLTFYIQSITTNYLSTDGSLTNTTNVTNSTGSLNLGGASGAVRDVNGTLTVNSTSVADNISVTWGSTSLGNLTVGGTQTHFNVSASDISESSNSVTFASDGNGTNVTSISLDYTWWNSSIAYSVSDGAITPSTTGIFLTTYEYLPGSHNVIVDLLLTVVLILLAMAALVFVSGFIV